MRRRRTPAGSGGVSIIIILVLPGGSPMRATSGRQPSAVSISSRVSASGSRRCATARLRLASAGKIQPSSSRRTGAAGASPRSNVKLHGSAATPWALPRW